MNTEEALRALAQAKARQKLADLYALIYKAGSGKHYGTGRIAFQERLRREVRNMVLEGVGILTIEKYVLRKIHDEEEGSIR